MQGSLNLSGRARLPIIRQNEAAECGLACLTMVAAYYGLDTDLATLRRRYAMGLQGMTLRHIMDVADSMQFATRPLKVPLEKVGHIRLPAVLHWDLNHFVVLKSVSAGKYMVHDPAKGAQTYSEQEFSDHFTGIALELTPTEGFQKRRERTTLKLSDLWQRIHGLKRTLLQVFLLSIILQLLVLTGPFYLQLVIDDVLTKFDTDLLLILAIGFAGIKLIGVITQVLRGYVLLYFGSMLSFQMVGNLFRHLIRLPADFFEKRHMGDITSRFGSMEPIKNMLTEGLIASVIDGMMAITTLVMMFLYSPTLAMIALCVWLVYLSLRLAFYRPLRAAQEDMIINRAEEQTNLMETVRGIVGVKLHGGEGLRTSLWQNRYANLINSQARTEKLNIWFQSAHAGLFGIELVVIVFVAAKMVLAGEFSVGMIFAFITYKRHFSDKASALVETAIEFRMLGLHLERIADIAHAETEDTQEALPGALQPAPLAGEIQLKGIHYRYADNTPDVLTGTDLLVRAGESVAITGTSGCGKTTLLKVMTGLFKPTAGSVLVDGVPLTEYGLAPFRHQIGVVMQEDDLFAGSIAENIAFFDQEIDMDQVIEAARTAQIHDEIMAMPMKYESLVGDMGAALSGGQKQRVMLARALYRSPKILFMDEGTAHLDVDTERRVNQAIAQMGITRIIVAHRPETIRSADRVLEMNKGRLGEPEGHPATEASKVEKNFQSFNALPVTTRVTA